MHEAILPRADDHTWAAAYPRPGEEDFARRRAEKFSAAAMMGIQAEDVGEGLLELSAEEQLKRDLTLLAETPLAPTPASQEQLATIKADREAQRLALQIRVMANFSHEFDAALEAVKAIQASAHEFRTVISKIRNVPRETYLAAIGGGESANLLVTRLFESITSLVSEWDNGPTRVNASASAIKDAIGKLSSGELNHEERENLMHLRKALENDCETPSRVQGLLRQVLNYRKRVNDLAAKDVATAIQAAAMPTREQTAEHRSALHRRLAGVDIESPVEAPVETTPETIETETDRTAFVKRLAGR
jgi:hypothetical protein